MFLRLPGVEPGSIAWKAIILTVGLQTLVAMSFCLLLFTHVYKIWHALFATVKAEADLQWRQSDRGICGDRVLQGSQLCWQRAPHGTNTATYSAILFFSLSSLS